jgi:hypothetical protein
MQRPLWVTAAGTMDAIALVDPGVARDAFESDHAIALGGRAGATAGRAWASCAAFEGELAAGTIAADVRVAMYDPERWRATPPEEQADPASAMERFGRIAAEHGYTRIITPHPGLMTAAGTGFALAEGETEEAAYLRSGLTGAAARAADIVETQSQRLQTDPDAYRRLVEATAAEARGANPDVWVLSGLATSPGSRATPEILLAAWERVRDVVDGHYISLSKARYPEVMTAFLRMTLERSS